MACLLSCAYTVHAPEKAGVYVPPVIGNGKRWEIENGDETDRRKDRESLQVDGRK